MHLRKTQKCGRVKHLIIRLGLNVFNATFNNISVIWWRSVLLAEETWVPKENHLPAAITDMESLKMPKGGNQNP